MTDRGEFPKDDKTSFTFVFFIELITPGYLSANDNRQSGVRP